jgi:hypothetical protein
MVVARVVNKWIIAPLPLVRAGGWRRVPYSSGVLVAALLAREEAFTWPYSAVLLHHYFSANEQYFSHNKSA